ncbi:4-hydroxy-3-methylbut-2-en-1-yl diphosphate synthase [Aliiroseovarius zhejiangensis]|uniref:4-hydroxy-3-methylbut-2-en-1-yl diphosphate synthase n=2 Tax=Aliiroseovarius zhejiangensis TaxID=1632025 RepID=A0ABQ3IP64_9RHOB|nr:helix-turn-helix domain-containing protein [Aliiroseovarius zhejiangensis]GHE86816.1 4-hydroxy-3-methylbut-2-en-1-yl diphosphate synthase [Aliiroseovarius zhejiangensis]
MIGRWNTPRVEEEDKPTGFDSYDLRLGDVMRGERATLGKSLLDVQRELKIKATYIAAIENADVSAFETQGFIAGYVRSYARYLGMDPEWAYKTFCKESGFTTAHGLSASVSKQADKSKPVAKRADHSGDPLANPNANWVPQSESIFAGIEPGAVGSVAVLAALIGLLGFGGWSVLQEIQRVDFAPIEQTPGVLAELPDVGDGPASFRDEDGSELLAAAGAGLSQPPSAEALDRLYRPQALEVPVLTHRDAPISTLDPASVGVLAGVTTPDLGVAPTSFGTPMNGATIADRDTPRLAVNETSATAEGDPANAAPAVQVLGAQAAEVAVFAVRPSWIRIQSADGTVIFEKILDAGEHYVLPKTEQAPVMRTGNAGSVYFAVNGTAYGPSGDGPSVVKNVALSQEALTEAFAVANMENDADLATYVAELNLSR